MLLRRNILLSKIKIHSSLSHLFSEKKLVADLTHYSDIPRYLGAMHPRFAAYAQKSYLGEIDEGYFILDKKLVPLTNNDFIIKRIKKDDEFYVVPAALGMSPGAMGGAIGAGATSTAAATGGIFGTGITASTLAVNAGLALVTSLFTQSPESIKSTDQAVRANDMFGSLQSTISSGTPIPLISKWAY